MSSRAETDEDQPSPQSSRQQSQASTQHPVARHASAAAIPAEAEDDDHTHPPTTQPLLGGTLVRSSSHHPTNGDQKARSANIKQSVPAARHQPSAGAVLITAAVRPDHSHNMVPFEVEEAGEGDEEHEPFMLERLQPPRTRLPRALRWVLSFAVPGMGMFSEAYFVFSIGNLRGVFSEAYPECWQQHLTCSKDLIHTLTYSQVTGIILGQLGIGFFADRLGRRLGSVAIAAIMLLCGVLIASSTGSDSGALFLMFTVSQALFGVGVGGEYPVAAASASERAEQAKHLQQRRGETVVLTFSMQGWGNFANTLVLVALMWLGGQLGPPYSKDTLEVVWRLSYILGLVPVAAMLVWRVWFLKESEVWRRGREVAVAAAAAAAEQGWDGQKGAGRWGGRHALLLRHYWHRIAGTALCWFVWDFAFYGNKLFQSTFIEVITPGATLLQVLLWTLLNSGVALVGYYCAAFTVDKAWMGRKRMQAMGFAAISLLFSLCAVLYPALVRPRGIRWFQFLYYFSSFWGQWGPNATTWLLPAELVPTEMRSMCHGFASAVGKLGALGAGVVFGLVGDRAKFWISAVCGVLGVALTMVLIPDVTTLDLREGDARWSAIAEGRPERYSGEAVNPRHLSYLERTLGYGGAYREGGGGEEQMLEVEPL